MHYKAVVAVINIEYTYTLYIDGSLSTLLTPVFEFNDCLITVVCNRLRDGSCSIQYGQDSSYQDLSPPIQSPLNSPITLPLLEPNTIYYSLATVTINTSFIFQVTGSFSTGPCEFIG